MAREGIFSTLASLVGDLDGVRFLDLYAGSGAVGLEAWSRGAIVTLVESAPRALDVIRSNIAALGPADGVTVIGAKVELAAGEGWALPPSAFDVVFADPPYAVTSGALAEVLAGLRPAFATDAIVVVERASRDAWSWPEGVEAVRERRYGDATVWYGRAARAAANP
jgi:16S rRNA (guanine966-N2)-methyltransferase